MRPAARLALLVLAAVGAVLTVAAPLAAQEAGATDAPGSFVVFTGRLDVPEGEVYDDAVIFDGDARIAGEVRDNVVAFNGDITVSGHVGEDVVALSGRVTLESGAEVGGDVVSRDQAQIAEGATVGGTVSSDGFPTDFKFDKYVQISRVAIWFATSVSSLVLGLLLLVFAPRAGEAVATTAASRFGASIGFGFVVFLGLPIAAVVALVTIVGLPLGLGVLLALGLLFWIGYVAAAFAIGRQLVKPPTSRMLAFLVGWGILRIAAIVPVIGGLAWFLATVFGLGALTLAARRRAGTEPVPVPVPAGVVVPPPPPMPQG